MEVLYNILVALASQLLGALAISSQDSGMQSFLSQDQPLEQEECPVITELVEQPGDRKQTSLFVVGKMENGSSSLLFSALNHFSCVLRSGPRLE